MHTYRIALGRVVIETAEVEIEAADDTAAIADAIARAPELHWSGQFEPSSYWVHMHDVVYPESADTGKWRLSPTPDDLGSGIRYVLLKADLDTAEGSLLVQPWIEDEDGVDVSDICAHWINELERLRIRIWDSCR